MTKKMLRWLKWLSLSLTGLVVVILFFVVTLLYTNPGLNLILWGAQKALPELSIKSGDGAIFPQFTLHQVHYKNDDLFVDLAANKLTLAVTASCLTEPAICIDDLAIEGLTFSMPELPASSASEAEASSEPVTRVSTPIPINVGRLALNDIDLNVLGHKVSWQRFLTGIGFKGNRLEIRKTQWDDIDVTLAPTEASQAEEDTGVSEGDDAAIVLPEVIIPLNVVVSRFDIHRFTLHQDTPIVVNHLGLEASANQSKVNVKTLELSMPEIEARLNTDIELSGAYPLNLQLNSTLNIDPVKGQQLELEASGSVAKLNLDAHLSDVIKGQLSANIEALDPNLPFDLHAQNFDVQWPLAGEGDYFAQVHDLKGSGSLKGYELDLAGDVQGQSLPDLTLKLVGEGSLEHIDLSNLQIDTLGGTVLGSVSANWAELVNWKTDLTLEQIQPGLQWPEAEGMLSGQLQTSGSLTQAGGWEVDVPLLDIQGIIREYPLDVHGSLRASDEKGDGELYFLTPKLSLAHGPNGIEVAGYLDSVLNLSVQVNAPQFSKTLPDLKGSLSGDIEVKGELETPSLHLALRANDVAWQELASLKSLSVNGDVTPLPFPDATWILWRKGSPMKIF